MILEGTDAERDVLEVRVQLYTAEGAAILSQRVEFGGPEPADAGDLCDTTAALFACVEGLVCTSDELLGTCAAQ